MKSTLIICIDGLGFDLVSELNTPFLHSFQKKKLLSRLKTWFAFTGIEYCFFSGKTPKKTGIWLEFSKENNSIFNSDLLKFFSFNTKLRNYYAIFIQLLNKRTWLSSLYNIPANKLKYFETSAKQGLWKLDIFKNKKFVFYKWPFFVVSENGKENIKKIYKYETDEQRLNRLLSVKNKEIYYTQLMEIDKTIHKHGKKSNETGNTLIKIDRLIKKAVICFFEDNPNGNIIIWSDHGFCDIKEYIDIEKVLPKRKDYLYFIAGTTASFWFNNKDIEKEVLNKIERIKEIKILDKKTAQKYKIPLSKRYGDLIVYVEKGKYFFPNFYQKKLSEKFKSMHGYPEDKELDGFLISNFIKKMNLKMNDIIPEVK